MPGCPERVERAFAHQAPDRTPLFEIFQTYHPIYWDICGRNVATDQVLCWDAMAEGISWEELTEADAKAYFQLHKYFEVDIVHTPAGRRYDFARPIKLGDKRWRLNGLDYTLNERTKLIELANPAQNLADSQKISETDLRHRIETWDGTFSPQPDEIWEVFRRVKALAAAEGLDWYYLGEVGAGTGVAFYPPFQLMWLVAEPELHRAWMEMMKAPAFHYTKQLVAEGCRIIAMGGDVSCDKGPFLSPAHYHEFILPVIQEHIDLIHQQGALAVYTSDGNHWPIKEDFFFHSHTDGYMEVDKAAGMTFERLIAEGVADKVCILGNLDARHTLCLGTPAQVKAEVRQCLELGQKTPGGHILHASHSVHEDVRLENYHAAVAAYREYFGLTPLPWQPPACC